MRALSETDRELVEAAPEAIRRRYRYDWQEVGAALRTRYGDDCHRRQSRRLSWAHGGLRRGHRDRRRRSPRRRTGHRHHRRGAASQRRARPAAIAVVSPAAPAAT